jgi:hypothetical protein
LAYWQACRDLRDRYASEDEQGRVSFFCGPKEGGDGYLETMAETYGYACAYSGDHSSSPEEVQDNFRMLASLSRYAELASQNVDHFHPKVTVAYSRYQDAAFDHALKASVAASNGRLYEVFLGTFYNNAFADHFLQDSFCACHMGFNRANAGAAAMKIAHDSIKGRPRSVMLRSGEIIAVCGDGDFSALFGNHAHATYPPKEQCSGRNRDECLLAARIVELTKLSVAGVINAFATGKRENNEAGKIIFEMPQALDYSFRGGSSCCKNAEADGSADNPPYDWHSLMTVFPTPIRGLSLGGEAYFLQGFWGAFNHFGIGPYFDIGIASENLPLELLLGAGVGYNSLSGDFRKTFNDRYNDEVFPVPDSTDLKAGVSAVMGYTNNGLISHEAGLIGYGSVAWITSGGGSEPTRYERDVRTRERVFGIWSLQAGYTIGFELATFICRLSVGPGTMLYQKRLFTEKNGELNVKYDIYRNDLSAFVSLSLGGLLSKKDMRGVQ